jgi:hypothetical protein
LSTNSSNSIAIIGGADGPTSIFISGSPILTIIIIVLILLIVVGVIYKVFKKKSQK